MDENFLFFFNSLFLNFLIQKNPPQNIFEGDSLWAHLESNQAPTDYESVALTE